LWFDSLPWLRPLIDGAAVDRLSNNLSSERDKFMEAQKAAVSKVLTRFTDSGLPK
jgi:hypothetical protein